jgi:hypothetical protein
MPGARSRERQQRPIKYRDREGRVWYASEVAQLKVVSAAIDGPNLCLVIRFEREGEERFANWIGGEEWRWRQSLHRLFAEAEPRPGVATSSGKRKETTVEIRASDDRPTAMHAAPPTSVRLWCDLVKSMGPDELDSFEQETFAEWDRASLGDLRIAIQRRRRELAV